MSKYGGFSGPHFSVFGLNTGKYGPENTPYLDTFHAVKQFIIFSEEAGNSWQYYNYFNTDSRSSHPEVQSKETLYQSNFIEIALRHGCSPVNLLHIFRTLFTKNTSERQLLWLLKIISVVGLQLFRLSIFFPE